MLLSRLVVGRKVLLLLVAVVLLRHDQPPRPRTKPRLRSSSVGARCVCDFGAGDASCMKSSQSDCGTSATSYRNALNPFDLFTWAGVVCLFHLSPLEASPAAMDQPPYSRMPFSRACADWSGTSDGEFASGVTPVQWSSSPHSVRNSSRLASSPGDCRFRRNRVSSRYR